MPLPQQRSYTVEDIYALPDGTSAELIDGVMYRMAPPGRKHQDISFVLSRKIADHIDSKGCTDAPDWIIEVGSPGSRRMDYFTNLFKYRTNPIQIILMDIFV